MEYWFLVFVVHFLGYVRCYYEADADTSPVPNIYYEPQSGISFRLSSIENVLINRMTNDGSGDETQPVAHVKSTAQKWGGNALTRRLAYRSNGCTCQGFICGCCLGINLNQFQFNREGCMNFTYEPQEFAVTMNMVMDGNSVFSYTFSAKNPPPLCIPVPIPYVPLQVETCARLYDIYTPGQNLHMCFDFETRIERATVLVLHFDCMRMGNDGVAFVKPGDVGALPPSLTTPSSQLDSDVYDQVTEIKKNNQE